MQAPENIAASLMSLRDYFAAHALPAILVVNGGMSCSLSAAAAYDVADAMLQERSNPHPTTWPGLFTNTDFAKE